ncbi:unnamed protein product, partial [Mesorhabditis belari]|uniref:Uncharacterized protein n=1 Tax=Mesorhabditis belari TaxID=2138241 RepID=A0AAF3EBG6_9BILA
MSLLNKFCLKSSLRNLFALFFLATISYSFDNSALLLKHSKICGDPFADPIWVPVLDLCQKNCDSLKEFCVENEDLEQMCKSLPDACIKMIERELKVENYKAALQSSESPRTTPSQQNHNLKSPRKNASTNRKQMVFIWKKMPTNNHQDRAPPADLSNPPPGALGLFPIFSIQEATPKN